MRVSRWPLEGDVDPGALRPAYLPSILPGPARSSYYWFPLRPCPSSRTYTGPGGRPRERQQLWLFRLASGLEPGSEHRFGGVVPRPAPEAVSAGPAPGRSSRRGPVGTVSSDHLGDRRDRRTRSGRRLTAHPFFCSPAPLGVSVGRAVFFGGSGAPRVTCPSVGGCLGRDGGRRMESRRPTGGDQSGSG